MLLLKKLNRKSGSTSNNRKKMETPDILHLKPNAPVDDVNSDEYNTQAIPLPPQPEQSLPNSLSRDITDLPMPAAKYHNKNQLLEVIRYDENIAIAAMNAARQSNQQSQQKFAGQFDLWQKLARWSSHKSSRTLVVTDRGQINNGFLPCSAMCTEFLSRQWQVMPTCIILRWYCGYNQHKAVEEMALNLYGQLVSSGTIDDLACGPAVDASADLDTTLGRLKRALRAQLCETPVFCFLDFISEYGNGETRRSGMQKMLKAFAATVTDRHLHAFKLLVTNRSHRVFDEVFRPTERNTMQHYTGAEEGGC